ncbi:hypothetical protein GQ457_16G026850 [Hibiscus cannabinus]
MGSKFTAIVFILLIFMLMLLPPMYACVPCKLPHPPPYHHPNSPYHKGSLKVKPPSEKPPMPSVVIVPPITNLL